MLSSWSAKGTNIIFKKDNGKWTEYNNGKHFCKYEVKEIIDRPNKKSVLLYHAGRKMYIKLTRLACFCKIVNGDNFWFVLYEGNFT